VFSPNVPNPTVCRVAPRTHRNWKTAAPSARTVIDAGLTDALRATIGTPEGIYGRRKMTAYLRRQGYRVAACTVNRLMRSPVEKILTGRQICWIATSLLPCQTASGSTTSPTPEPGVEDGVVASRSHQPSHRRCVDSPRRRRIAIRLSRSRKPLSWRALRSPSEVSVPPTTLTSRRPSRRRLNHGAGIKPGTVQGVRLVRLVR
jgi:hypothetical protein